MVKKLTFGPCAVVLGPAVARAPGLDLKLSAWDQALVFDRFLRAGGEDAPVTPTEARVRWDEVALYVAFRCSEPNPRYRPVRRTGLANPAENPAFSDSVTVQLRPDWTPDAPQFLFQLASSGDHWAQRRRTNVEPEPLDGYEAEVLRGPDTWVARMAIPWALIGGRPRAFFGLNVFRRREQASELLSPVPLPMNDNYSPDLCLETAFGDVPQVHIVPGMLTTLPSGALRWQRPAKLVGPTHQERVAIWRLQEELAKSTTPDTLAERVHLVQRWLDLLLLEGFSFHTDGGCWTVSTGEYSPESVRAAVNVALRNNDATAACAVLDAFLHQLDVASRRWFADGSPGNVRDDVWTPLTNCTSLEMCGNEVVLEGSAGTRPVKLRLSCPMPGCLRVCGETAGYFTVAHGEAIAVANSTVTASKISATLTNDPWALSIRDAEGQERFRIVSLAFRLAPDGRVLATDIRLALAPDEGLFGFGERFDVLNQRGRILTLWDSDAWVGNVFGLRNHAYKPIPLFHSTRGYTVFVNSSYRLRADAGASEPDRCRLTLGGPVCDFFVWTCTPLEALQGYTGITGRPVLPPRWVFEPWMGGGHGRWKNGPLKDSTAQVLDVVNRFAALDIPHSAVYPEGEACTDQRLFTGLAPKNLRPLSWMNSTINLQKQRSFLPGVPDAELPILRRADGSVFPYIDFTHPRALELVRAHWRKELDLGIAGSMVDFGDLVPEDAVFHDGRRGDAMHNFYAYDYHRIFQQAFAERRGDDHVLFSRSAAPGSQRWLCQFAGDHLSNFVGLTAALHGGLNLSACGFSTWGCDIGGYLGWPDPETYIRWVEWGCFSPIMRCHGTEPREPWEFSEEAVRIYAFYAWLRENLFDYIYSAAVEAHRTGVPMMRALPLAFPGVASVATCDDGYLFGPDLLVAPMHTGGDSRTVRFPSGRWTDFWSAEVVAGPAVREVKAPLDRIPLYLRAGAMIPVHLNAALDWGASMTKDRVTALVVTPPDQPETSRCWQTSDVDAEIHTESTRDGFTVTLDGRAETRYLLIYSSPIAAVTVSGKSLPRLPDASLQPCWYQRSNHFVVHLPQGVRQEVIVKME